MDKLIFHLQPIVKADFANLQVQFFLTLYNVFW